MKKLIVGALLALSSIAFGATLAPIQSLSPAGSTAGQVITSTGASSAPAWQSITFGVLPQIAANTVLGNSGGSAAAPAALAIPSCSGANNALLWTAAAGFTCGANYALTTGNLSQFATTTSAQLAGVVTDETGSGPLVFSTSPTITTPTILGVTNGSNAAAGQVGQYVTNSGTGVPVTTNVAVNITSISLTAGDWDVSGVGMLTSSGGGVINNANCGISTTSATLGPVGTFWQVVVPFTANTPLTFPTPTVAVNVSTATTAYLVCGASFSATVTGAGTIRARRMH